MAQHVMTRTSTSNDHKKRRRPDVSLGWAIACYAAFGALHEVSHLAAAWAVGRLPPAYHPGLHNVARALLGRHVVVATGAGGDEGTWAWKDHLVRHAGWMASAALAFVALQSTQPPSSTVAGDDDDDDDAEGGPRWSLSTAARVAAVVTFIEAVSTDLLGLIPAASANYSSDATAFVTTLFCGNFGVILINAAWAGKREALDVLEKMVQITMMRGAQSGGVVTWAGGGGRALH